MSGPDDPVLRAQLPTRTEVAQRECPSERSAGGLDDGDVRVQASGFVAESLDELVACGSDSPGESDANRVARGAVLVVCGVVRVARSAVQAVCGVVRVACGAVPVICRASGGDGTASRFLSRLAEQIGRASCRERV